MQNLAQRNVFHRTTLLMSIFVIGRQTMEMAIGGCRENGRPSYCGKRAAYSSKRFFNVLRVIPKISAARA